MPDLRIVLNRHGSATRALAVWSAGSLWGAPIRLGPDKFHVYGCWRRCWEPVNIEFRHDRIIVMRPSRRLPIPAKEARDA